MNVSKSNLVAILLEVGEENAAVLLARSDLPDEIDLQRDLDFLTALGLDRDQVDEVAQLTIGSIESDDVNRQRQLARWKRPSRGDGPTLLTSG